MEPYFFVRFPLVCASRALALCLVFAVFKRELAIFLFFWSSHDAILEKSQAFAVGT